MNQLDEPQEGILVDHIRMIYTSGNKWHLLHLFYPSCIVKQGLGLLSLFNPFVPIVGHVFCKGVFQTLLFIPQAPPN